MPIYEYECTECGKIEEVIQHFSDAPLTACSHCSGKLVKLISQSSFHLKGTGWYVTDYASKTPKGAPSQDKKGDSSDSGAGGKTSEPAASKNSE